MENYVRRNYNLLKILYSVRYFGDAFFYAFFPLYLSNTLGFSDFKYGIIISIIPITTLIANPFWNFISKDVNVNRKIIRISTIVEGFLIIIFGRLTQFEVLALMMFMISTLTSPFYSLIDGFTGTFCDKTGREYPKIRLLGSLAFAISVAIGGVLSKYIGFSNMFMISGIIFISCSVIINYIKPIDLSIQIGHENEEKRDIKALFKNKHFLFYIFLYLFTYVLGLTGDSFFGPYLTKVRGITDAQYGLIYFSFVMVEVFTILFVNKFLKKANYSRLIIIAGIMYSFKYISIYFDAPLWVIISSTFFRGSCWGILLTINIRYLIQIIRLKNLTAAVFTLSIFQAFFQGVFSIFGGKMIELFGYEKFYFGISISALIATFIYFLGLRTMKYIKKHQNINENKIIA